MLNIVFAHIAEIIILSFQKKKQHPKKFQDVLYNKGYSKYSN